MSISLVSEVFDTVRGFLNDINANIWTNTVLLTRLPHAHRELQIKLRNAGCSVMITTSNAITVTAGSTTTAELGLMIEPIELFENSVAGGLATAIPMTESNPLPQAAQTTALKYWEWTGSTLKFIGATVDRDIFIRYWRRIDIPTLASSPIGIWEGELYLAPKIAAIAAGSVGQSEMMATFNAMAESALVDIIKANKGRSVPMSGGAIQP